MKKEKFLDIVSNGFGGQSIYLMYLASIGAIPATHNFCADTGSERDCTLNDGSKIAARDFYFEFIEPFCKKAGIESFFIRALDKTGAELPPLHEYISAMKGEAANGFGHQPVPLFGSNGGRLMQQCTDKWKIGAIRQQARRLGVTALRSAQGIHAGEAWRRVKGIFLRNENGFDIYQTIKGIDKKTNQPKIIKWQTHYYPLVDLKLNREQIRERLEKLKLPFLVSSECDMCPHQDLPRWERRSDETKKWIADLESKYNGEFFFTEKRKPLLKAIEKMMIDQSNKEKQGNLFGDELDFGCSNYICGI